jgi:hypothetical protein
MHEYGQAGGFPFFNLHAIRNMFHRRNKRHPIYSKSKYIPISSMENRSLVNNAEYGKLTGRVWDPKDSKFGDTPHFFNPTFGHQMVDYWDSDSCIEQVSRNCYERFFHGSTENDILIFMIPIVYIRGYADGYRWMQVSLQNLREHIAATFKGTVFRFVTTQTRDGFNNHFNEKSIKPMNEFIWQEAKLNTDLRSLANEDRPWYTIDQWAINEDRMHLYNDNLHFNGPLTHALLHQVLNEVCPVNPIETNNSTSTR